MLAFRKAVEEGADGIELDIHLSEDNEIMIHHDESLLRTTGRDALISSYKRSELEKINAGKDHGFTPIPSLEEYIDYIKDKKIVTNIELKTAPLYYPGIEEKAISMVAGAGLLDAVIFSSFNWLSISLVKKIAPEAKAGLLISPRLYNMGPLLKEEKIDYFHPDFSTVSEKMVENLHVHGIGINVWTLDEEEDIEWMAGLAVDGIITNCPDRAIRIVRGKRGKGL